MHPPQVGLIISHLWDATTEWAWGYIVAHLDTYNNANTFLDALCTTFADETAKDHAKEQLHQSG